MAQFRDISIAPTEEQIEKSVREDGGILRSFGYGFSCPGDAPETVGGWGIRLVDKRGMGNHGNFIAVALTPATLSTQKQATMGLLREWADKAEAGARGDAPCCVEGWADCPHDSAQSAAFRERGDFACAVVPLLHSPAFERRGCFLFADEKWAYFAHSHANFLRVGDGRHRLWVRPARRRQAA